MDWPVRSPDLNAIQQVWDTLLKEWEEIAPEVILSMPRRCVEVLRVRGRHTH
jgi:hypothetical protein